MILCSKKTSKISLDDIKQIRKEENKKEEEKKVYSPYIRKFHLVKQITNRSLPVFVLRLQSWHSSIGFFMVVTEEPPRTEELRIEKEGMISYEYTY